MTAETKYRIGYVFGHYATLCLLIALVASLGWLGGMMYANTRIRSKVFKEIVSLKPPTDDLTAGDVARLVSRHAHPRISFQDLRWLDRQEHILLREPQHTNGWFLSVEKRLNREWTNAQRATLGTGEPEGLIRAPTNARFVTRHGIVYKAAGTNALGSTIWIRE